MVSLVALVLLGTAASVLAQSKPPQFPLQGRELDSIPAQSPEQEMVLREVAFEQKLDAVIPGDAVFRNEQGEAVQLSRFGGDRPVVVALVYYECTMLCTEVLNGVLRAAQADDFEIGTDYDIVVISIDPRETPELAARKKARYIREYGRPGAEAGWHFLTGDKENIDRVADAIGYRYKFLPESGQFAHPGGIVIATPGLHVSRYLFGVMYEARDYRLGLVEASERRIGTPVDTFMLLCYHYDPTTGKYGVVVMNIVRLVGAITVLALVALIVVLSIRGRQRRPSEAAA